LLAGFLRNRETTKFLVAPVRAVGHRLPHARRILERRELDALSIVCKARASIVRCYLTSRC